MKPATYTLAIVEPQPADLWLRLGAELDAQGSPPIRFEHEDGSVTFTSDTSRLLVSCRVGEALMAVCAHDEWTRAFQPLD